ncbi:MAG: 4Fe-4S dicluster domain-containing protein [Cyclobacteriaceae bacterium]
MKVPTADKAVLTGSSTHLVALFSKLIQHGYTVIGPVYRHGAILLEEVSCFEQLPLKMKTVVGAGTYQLNPDQGETLEHPSSPQSFKKFLYPPKRELWKAVKTNGEYSISKNPKQPPKMAFWGIQSCDLRAIALLDRIFIHNQYINPWYQQARASLVTIAIACTHGSDNCFCTTTNSGPKPIEGYDVLVSPIGLESANYLVQSGSEAGQKLIADLELKNATQTELESSQSLIDACIQSMPKRFDSKVSAVLQDHPNHPIWNQIAEKCMCCANCTLVCPTCFCSTVEDVTDITGSHTERWLKWDSCFNGDFSYIHGGQIRNSIKSRYRQWLTHKLSNWHDQFGSSGCVGCGRCITWCPVGIDLTEEVNKLKPDQA